MKHLPFSASKTIIRSICGLSLLFVAPLFQPVGIHAQTTSECSARQPDYLSPTNTAVTSRIRNYDPAKNYLLIEVQAPSNNSSMIKAIEDSVLTRTNGNAIEATPVNAVSLDPRETTITIPLVFELPPRGTPSTVASVIYAEQGGSLFCEGSNYTFENTSTSNPNPLHECEAYTDPTRPSNYNSQACQDWRETRACQAKTGDERTECTARIKCKTSANPDRCFGTIKCQTTKGAVYTALFTSTDENGNATNCFTLAEFIPLLLSYFMMFAAIIAGFMFIWAGYKYLTSRGNPTALADARDMIMQAVIGLVILALAYVIIQILDSAFSQVDEGIQLWSDLTKND